MSIKKIIIKIIGLDKVLYFYSRYNFIRDFFYRLIRNQKKIYSNIVDNEIDNIRIYSIPNSHCFFGYYDLDQINTKENKLLAHVVPRNAETQTTISKIGYFDIETGEFHHIAETSAWCWQQGSRLIWNPKNENQIVFNNISEGKFVTQVWDIEKKSLYKRNLPCII